MRWEPDEEPDPQTPACIDVATWWARDWNPWAGTDEMPEYSRMVQDLGDWVKDTLWKRPDNTVEFAMFTELGNTLVAQLVEEAKRRTLFKRSSYVYAFIRGASQAYAERGHDEVFDIATRTAVANALDEAWVAAYGTPCDKSGWMGFTKYD